LENIILFFKTIDLDFREKDLWEAAVVIWRIRRNIDIYQGHQCSGCNHLVFRKVPLWSALNHILRINGYGILESKGAFRIVPYEEAVSTPLKNYLLEQSKPVACPVFIWDANTGSPNTVLDGHQGTIFDLAFSNDGSTLATVSADHTVRLWNINDTSTQRVLSGHSDLVHGLIFSPDGRYLATYSLDNKINVWNFLTGRNVGQYTGHAALPVSVFDSAQMDIQSSVFRKIIPFTRGIH
jgi:WD40 repeat protein